MVIQNHKKQVKYIKKFLAISFALLLLICFAACGKNNEPKTESQPDGTEFKAPENYATVLIVTINPQFRLYRQNGTSDFV